MEVWKLVLFMSAAFVLNTKGQDVATDEESFHGVEQEKSSVSINAATEQEVEEVLVKEIMSEVTHTEPSHDEVDVKTWVSMMLREHYRHLSDVDIYMVKPAEMSAVIDHLMRDIILKNDWLSEEQSDCIVLVFTHGGLKYLYRWHLMHPIHQDIVKAINHVILHVPISEELLSSLTTKQNISKLIDLIYAPVNQMMHHLNVTFGTSDVTHSMFLSMDQMLRFAEIRHQSAHYVISMLVPLIWDWLQKLSVSNPYFDVPCRVRVEGAKNNFKNVISSMTYNLQVSTLQNFIVEAFSPDSTPIAEALAERLATLKSLWKLIWLMQTVQFEEVSVLIENNEFIQEHIQLHQGNRTVFGYIVDTFLEITRRDYLIDLILQRLEHASVTGLPFTTPVYMLHPGDLLPITQEGIRLLFEFLPQKCLDTKMLAGIAGFAGVKRMAFSPNNPGILSILHKTWAVLMSLNPEYNNHTFKFDFWFKAAHLIDTFYMESLGKLTMGIEAITGGELLSETLAADTLILVHDHMPETLKDLFHDIVEIHVTSLLEDIECEYHGEEVYQLVVRELEMFAHHLHLESSYVETHLCELLVSLCSEENKALVTEISVVLSEAITSVVPDIQSEVFHLISLWHTSEEPLSYYRTTFTDFIGAVSAKFLYLQMKMLPPVLMKPPEEVEINQNLLSLVVWQHQLIQHLHTSYMERMSDMMSSGYIVLP